MWLKHSVLIFLSVFAGISAWPYKNFVPGFEYKYHYGLNIESSAVGTTDSRTGMDFDCNIRVITKDSHQSILLIDKCTLSDLREISPTDFNVELKKSKNSDKFSLEVTEFPAYFNISEGEVESVYFHDNQTLLADNFMRGIISLFIGRKAKEPLKYSEYNSYFVSKVGRVDVQGYCDVYYKDSGVTNRYTMVKDMKSCHFPSKPDWENSPWSLFWNSSFIQAVEINSTAECDYEFASEVSDFQELKSVVCKERHARLLESTKNSEISVQTNIKQKLNLVETKPSKHWTDKSDKHLRYDITMLHASAISQPTDNPEDAEKTIQKFLTYISVDLGKLNNASYIPDKERTTTFGELIDYLREVHHLEKITQELIDTSSTKDKLMPLRIHKLLIYRDALFQCHRVHCFKNFRELLKLSEPILSLVINDDYLFSVYDALFEADVDDVNFLNEIKELCKAKPEMRNCPLVLSSAINTMWYQNHEEWTDKTKIPAEVVGILDYLTSVADGKDVRDHILKFKIIGTLGEILEIHNPDILNQLFQYEVTDIDRVPRVEATRKFRTTDALYKKLISILKDESHPQEERVSAYLILVDKWQTENLAYEIQKIFTSKTADYNLKTFIYSHLSALTRRIEYNVATFARNLLSHVIADTNLEEHFLAGEYNSEYDEHDLVSTLSYLPKAINRIALRLKDINLYDGKNSNPFYYGINATMNILQNEYDVESSILFQGLQQVKRQVQNTLGHNIDDAFGNIMQKMRNLPNKTTSWPYHIDSAILSRLKEITKKIADQFESKEHMDFLWSFREIGDDRAFFTFHDVIEYLTKRQLDMMKAGTRDSLPITPRSINVKFIEAENLVPTLGGIALSWATDAYWLSKIENVKSETLKKIPVHYDYRIGITTSLQHWMRVALSDYSDCGVQIFSKATILFNGMIELNQEEGKLSVGLPKQPVIISFSRQNTLIRNFVLEDIRPTDTPVTQNWCSDKLESTLGLRICHSRSYHAVTDNPNKPWTLMAGNSHWKYTISNVNDKRKVFSFKFNQKQNSLFPSNGISVIDENETDDKIKEKEIYSYKKDTENKKYEIHLGVQDGVFPHAVLKSDTKYFPNITFQATLFLTPNYAFVFNYTTKDKKLLLPEASIIPSRSKSVNYVTVTSNVFTATITTPGNQVFKLLFNDEVMPFIHNHDYYFNYSCGLPCNTWVKDVLPAGMWDDHGNAQISYHDRFSFLNQIRFNNYETVSTDQLRTPKSLYELRKTAVHNGGVDDFYHFNFTKFSLPTHERLTYLNISFGRRAGLERKEGGYNWTHHLATVSVPQATYYAGWKRKLSKGQESNRFALLQLPNGDLPGSKSITPASGITESGFKFDLRYKDRSSPESLRWSNYEESAFISYPLPWIGVHNITYTGEMIYEKSSISSWIHEFELECSQFDIIWKSKTEFQDTEERLAFLHASKMTVPGDLVLLSNDFNFTRLSEPPYIMRIKHKFETISFEGSIDHVGGREPCDEKKYDYGKTTINILAPRSPLFNTNISVHVCDGPQFLEASLEQYTGKIITKGVDENGNISIISTFMFDPKFHFNFENRTIEYKVTPAYPKIPAVVKYSIPTLDQRQYYFLQYYTELQQLIIRACYQEKCKDLQTNPDTFIAETLWDYSDDDFVFHSVVINTNKTIASSSELYRIQRALASPIKIHLNLNNAEQFNQLASQIPFRGEVRGHPLWNSLTEFAEPAVKYVHDIKNKDWKSSPFGSSMAATQFVWFWKYFNGTQLLAKALLDEFDYYGADDYEIDHGKRFVEETAKFTRIRQDMQLPYIRPDTYREIGSYFDVTRSHFQFKRIFHEPEYDRFALLFDNKNVMTFDGHFVRGAAAVYKKCPFLLTADVLYNRFAVYDHYTDLHFLFPDVHLRVNMNGNVFKEPGSVQLVLPARSDNKNVRISRRESVLTIDTDYGLMVRCVDLQFCLFYTSEATFGQLAGLMGNNNGIPQDDNQTLEQWNLSPGGHCGDEAPAVRTSDIHCYYLFGNFYDVISTYQCLDIVEPYHFQLQCSEGKGDSCATGAAYLALCAAHGVEVVQAYPECYQCHGHSVGTSWVEHLDNAVEIVFVIDDHQDKLVKSEFIKSLQTLSTVISKEFAANKFQSTKFGIVGVNNHHWHDVNGKYFFTADDFISGHKLILPAGERSGVRNRNENILNALIHATSFQYNPKVVRIVSLLTKEDPSHISYDPELLLRALESFDSKGVASYTFADYPELSTQGDHFGMKWDGQFIPEHKNKGTPGVIPDGQYAKITINNRGALWRLSNLETKDSNTKAFMQEVAEEFVTNIKNSASYCRICNCGSPGFYEPEISCLFSQCQIDN